jgi:hypothetical protein
MEVHDDVMHDQNSQVPFLHSSEMVDLLPIAYNEFSMFSISLFINIIHYSIYKQIGLQIILIPSCRIV